MKIYYFRTFFVLLTLLILSSVWSAVIYHAPLSEHVFEQGLVEFKLPRILIGMTSGALFSLAGAILQDTMKNKIASPDILGVSSTSILCVLLMKFFYPSLGWLVLSCIALIGAFLGFILTFLVSYKNGRVEVLKFILIGTAIAIITKAGIQWILQNSPPEVTSALSYMVGTTYGAGWQKVVYVGLSGLVLFLLALLSHRNLIYFSLSDESARSIGFSLSFARKISIILAILCTGVAVMGVGNLGFIGLVAPNIARIISKNNKFWFLIFSAFIGMLLVVMAGALAKTLFYPVEVPVGVVTTIIGAPYFIWLLRKYF
jgi:iron complex transport system permease protein